MENFSSGKALITKSDRLSKDQSQRCYRIKVNGDSFVRFFTIEFNECSRMHNTWYNFALRVLVHKSNHALQHWASKKVSRYLQRTKGIFSLHMTIDVIGYADGDFGGCTDNMKSTSGYIFCVSWRC